MMHPGLRQVLPVALLTLAGGFALGFFFGRGMGAPALTTLPEDLRSWELAMTRELNLSPDQSRDLRVVLHRYEKERRRLLDAGRSLLEPELSALDSRFESLIRMRVLDAGQREQASTLEDPGSVVRESPSR